MPFDRLLSMISQRRHRETLYSTEAYWDSKAEQFEGHAISMWPNNALNRLYHGEQVAHILHEIPSVAGKVVLDVGCGTGRLSRWLAARGAVVTAIDFSARSLAIAMQATQGSNPAYKHMSMFEIEKMARYDLIFSWGVLTVGCRNGDDLRRVMERLCRALKPGGEMLLLEPIHRGFLHRVLNMSVGEFADIMVDTGFDVRSIASLHFWPMRLVLAYVPWPGWITKPFYHTGQAFMRLPGLNKMGDYTAIRAIRKD